MKFTLAIFLTSLILPTLALAANPVPSQTRVFKAVAVEIGKTKFWLPSNFTVKKGDKVEFHLTSEVPGKNNVHGFAIQNYGIEALVNEKGIVNSKEKIEFVANQAGIFPIYCQLHPGHVGGQLTVIE